MHGRGSLPRPRAGPATMAGDPAADRAKNGCGHVETGTMRHQRAPGEEEIGLWRDDLHPASPRPLTEPRIQPATTRNTPSKLVRKPQCAPNADPNGGRPSTHRIGMVFRAQPTRGVRA